MEAITIRDNVGIWSVDCAWHGFVGSAVQLNKREARNMAAMHNMQLHYHQPLPVHEQSDVIDLDGLGRLRDKVDALLDEMLDTDLTRIPGPGQALADRAKGAVMDASYAMNRAVDEYRKELDALAVIKAESVSDRRRENALADAEWSE